MMERLALCAFFLFVTTPVKLVSCIATLSFVPASANCGDMIELTCTSIDCNVGYTFRKNDATLYNQAGPANSTHVNKYSSRQLSSTEIRLIILNVEYFDAGLYSCFCRFDDPAPEQNLQYQCKANTTVSVIRSDKKLDIIVDRLYPQPSNIRTDLDDPSSLLLGSYTCVSSPTLAFHNSCTWVSNTSLPDGNHSYTITVTTGTQTAHVSGRFRIVTSTVPSISNLVNISNNDIQANGVLKGVQDTRLTIHCVSKESVPVPTLAWYRGNTSISPLAQSNTRDGMQQSDGTYTVTLSHSFTPSRRDDMTPFLCRAFYPGATNEASADPSPASANLYLDLKTDSPTVSQTNVAVTGGSMNLRCASSNGRPAPSITWSYRGQTFNATSSSSFDPTAKTYTVVSVLQRPVSAVDNGQTATCRVSSTTLSVPLTGTVIVDIKYPPSVTVSTTFHPSYTVTCRAEGYPDSYTYQDWVQIWPGYGSVATIPFTGTTLNLTGATYEQSGVYVCGASNGVAVYGTNVTLMKGNATVFIKAPPVLTDPSIDGTRGIIAGCVGQDASTEIKYWSNVAGSVVKCYKIVEGSRSSSLNCSVMESDTDVTIPVHNHKVTETGTLAKIKIHISNQDDMTSYDVVVSNGVQGESVVGFTIVPQGRPEAPTLLGNFSISPGQVILTVLPGYHGGYNQTLVVQISIDFTTWINKAYVSIGLDTLSTNVTLARLRENTLHHVRVFAYNSEGQSNNFSTVMDFITAIECTVCSSLMSTVAVSVSTTALITIIICTVVNVLVFRTCPNFRMWILQNTCPIGNKSKCTALNTVKQSQSLKRSGRQLVYSTLVAAENSTGLENIEATPTYESLNQSRSQPVYTSLEEAAEQRNTYENLKKQ